MSRRCSSTTSTSTPTSRRPRPSSSRATSCKQTSSSPASPPSTALRLGTVTSTSRQPTLWGPPTRSSSTGLPLPAPQVAASRAQRDTILATTSSPAQNALRSANTPSTTASARQRGLSCHLSRSKRHGACLHRGRAAGQAQEGHLVRATPPVSSESLGSAVSPGVRVEPLCGRLRRARGRPRVRWRPRRGGRGVSPRQAAASRLLLGARSPKCLVLFSQFFFCSKV
jgi:hypothetical protein